MATEVATTEERSTAQVPALTPEGERFALRQRQAKMFAMSPLVPEHLRKGSPEQAIANCWIALTLAEAMGEVPLIVMQNIHIVNGKAGFASQYMIARANSSGIFKGRIDWRIDRSDPNNLAVTAFAVLKETGTEVSVTCDMRMAKAEGWTKNAKYTTMPEVMLRYRSAAFLVRFYAPDVMLGYQTSEEIEDVALAAAPSTQPLTSKMLIDQSRPVESEEVPHDPETGEVIEPTSDSQIATDEATETEQSKEAEQKPARGRGRQQTAEPEKAEEPAAQEEVSADAPPVAEQLEDHPASAKADEIIGQFSKAETVIDLEQRYKENESDIAAMPDDIYETVMGGYNRHRVRLGAQRVSTAMPETVK